MSETGHGRAVGNEMADAIRALRQGGKLVYQDGVEAAVVEACGRIIAAQVTASASAGSILNQAAAMAFSGGVDQSRDFEPDSANVLLYEGNPLVYGHTISLTGGGKVVIVQNRDDPGHVDVKFVRDVNGESAIHTVAFSDQGIEP